MSTGDPRDDLAALVVPLGRALTAREVPVLEAHGLTMWGYVVLRALGGGTQRTQRALAHRIGADPTRLIPVLEELEGAGLLQRTRSPEDRRVLLVELTPAGRDRCAAAQAAIQSDEEPLLALLPAADRAVFLRSLAVLAAAVRVS